MFCPVCKSIIERIRTPRGILEFCRCPDKLKDLSLFDSLVSSLPKTPRKSYVSSLGSFESPRKTRRGTSTESIIIPKIIPTSEYSALDLDLRLMISGARNLPKWNEGKIRELLSKRLSDVYFRFYRKFEDFFVERGSDLKFVVFLIPNSTLTEFSVVLWGVGIIEDLEDSESRLLRWYQGTRL